MKKILNLTLIFLSLTMVIHAQKRAMTADDLWGMKRIGDVILSPDGKTIAYTITTYSMDLNKGNSDIWLMNSDGTNARALKSSEKNESQPRFSPDGKKIAYSFDKQIWTINTDGSGDKKLTSFYSGASDMEWSKDGKKILFTSSVYPDCVNEECNKSRDEEKEKSKVKASIFTELMYRYWDDWRGEKRSHLFLYDIDKNEYTDLTLSSTSDVPPVDLGSSNDFSFSPDGKEAALTMNTDKQLAISTNNDIFLVDLTALNKNQAPALRKISVSQGNDNQPVYSPDGKYIAFRSMERAGFEADRQRIMLYDRKTGNIRELTAGFDRSAGELTWSPDSRYIYFDAANELFNSIYRADITTGKVETVLNDHYNNAISVSPDGKMLYFKQQRIDLPYEIFSSAIDGKNVKQLTSVNSKILDQLALGQLESIWYEGAEGAKVQAVMVKPPLFDPSKKYPVVFLFHGGPQGHWADEFHFRWNVQMFAAPGYLVIAPNPRGSVGYGQKFTDEISGDWGGKAYVDLMQGYDYVINKFDFADKNNTFAAGASYGGYMISWVAGHTDRFNALVCHDGVFNMESMYGTTEEIWFPEWEMKGTPWTNREMYRKWSPHQYAENFKTPMLVIHGGMDFRVPEEQAFQLFTTLQRLGVESKFLYFPEESHFVTKPQNSRLWWNTIYDWFGKHYRRDK